MHSTALTDKITAALDLPTLDAFAALHELCEAERELRRDAVTEGDWATADAALDRILGPLADAARTLCPRTAEAGIDGDCYTARLAERTADKGHLAAARVPTVHPRHGLYYTTRTAANGDTLAVLLRYDGITLV